MRGTPTAYQALLESSEKPNNDTLYFISEPDSNDVTLYLGSKLISGGDGENNSYINKLEYLTDVLLSTVKDKDLLIYDKQLKKWVNSSFENAIAIFSGSGENKGGAAGLVPSSPFGKTNLFLRSDGTWAEISQTSALKNNILTIENEDSSRMHLDIINEIIDEDMLLVVGDMIIIKDFICDNKWQHTAYVYNGSTWAAMDGNYNAETVYFDEDFIFTKNIGTVEIEEDGNKKVSAKGKNIKDFLSSLFAQEEAPKVIYPSIEVKSLTAKAYEVGTKVTPSYEIVFNPGNYQYNSSTGVTEKSYHITDGENVLFEKTGSLPILTVEDDMDYFLTATVDYTEGDIPKTNLGNDCVESKILEGETTNTSPSITGYRYVFAGLDSSGTLLTSDFIRSLKKIGSSENNLTITWSATDIVNPKRFIVAIPNNSTKTLNSAIITSSMNANATADYKLQTTTIDVAGNNNYNPIPYQVWIYEPASIAITEKHEIKIK